MEESFGKMSTNEPTNKQTNSKQQTTTTNKNEQHKLGVDDDVNFDRMEAIFIEILGRQTLTLDGYCHVRSIHGSITVGQSEPQTS